ncbi:MAG TPA: dUTP diphosphatase [Firmicutes bacterium]|jgi:dUTP pyrophosphatase|nr:dUTP diphosphatase [Bacillota bacterium]
MTELISIPVVRMDHAEELPLPKAMTAGAAGVDLLAAIGSDTVIMPGGRALIATGLKIAIPQGFEGQVRPRSGLALNSGVTILNAPGTIDSDYRGEVAVILINLGQEPFTIKRGDRIAQLVICPVAQICFTETDSLPATERSDGGFGHTGIAQPPG